MVYDFKERCYEVMAQKGITTREFEDRTGVSRRNFFGWQNGKYPPVHILILIADELEVSVLELLGLNDPNVEKLRSAIADAKLSGCKTCYYGVDYGSGVAVCTRQDCKGGGIYPREQLSCWEWRGARKENGNG